jgi:hypothetical protein
MEKKQRQVKKKQSVESSKIKELVFTETDKKPCDNCKEPKEVSNILPKFTKDEMDIAMTIVDKKQITPDQMRWLIGLNNRVNNDNKMYGCGKCHVQVLKNIRNAYTRLYSESTTN